MTENIWFWRDNVVYLWILIKQRVHINMYQNQINFEQLEKLIKQGFNIKSLAEHFNIPAKSMSQILIKEGIKVQGSRYDKIVSHNYFEKIDNENKAYILGFILADGCIQIEPKKRNGVVYSYSKRLCFCNSIDDYEILNKIRQEISPQAKLKTLSNKKGAINRKRQISLRISSSLLIDDLIKLDIKPRKTWDTNFIFDFTKIPNDLLHHFVRGFFDGDGWFIPKGKSFGLVFTSKVFMDQIENIFYGKLPHIKVRKCPLQNKNMITYSLILSCGYGKSIDLFNYLYKDATIFLNRKYDKFIQANTEITSKIAKGLEVS